MSNADHGLNLIVKGKKGNKIDPQIARRNESLGFNVWETFNDPKHFKKDGSRKKTALLLKECIYDVQEKYFHETEKKVNYETIRKAYQAINKRIFSKN